MVTQSDYSKDEVDACLSVMVEVMTILGEFKNNIALVGGWVPYFLFTEERQEHTGSLDIDLALDFKSISDDTYRTILQLLEKRGYERGKQPFIFYRTVNTKGGKQISVEVDLLVGEYGGTSKSHRTQNVQDVKARKARGCDLVFQHTITIKLCKEMPDGAINEVNINISGVIPFLVMKGMALWDRYKEKDAYDIYFTISNYPGGTQELVKLFMPFIENKLVCEGLSKIKTKFNDINAPGPVWVVNFQEITNEEEKEIIKRDVFEKVNAFLDVFNMRPFQKG